MKEKFEERFEEDFPELSKEEHEEAASYLSLGTQASCSIKNPPEEVMASFVLRAQHLIGKEMSDEGKRIVSVMLAKLFAGYITSQGSMEFVDCINADKGSESVH